MRDSNRRAKGFKELQRRRPERVERDKILIVTEGEKTEPDYFRRLIDFFGLTTAKVRVSGEGGSAPLSVFEAAEAILSADEDFEQIYIVFDRDDHQSYEVAISKALGLSSRRKLKKKKSRLSHQFPALRCGLHCIFPTIAGHISQCRAGRPQPKR